MKNIILSIIIVLLLSQMSITSIFAQTPSNCEVNTVLTDTVSKSPFNPTIITLPPPPPPPPTIDRRVIWIHGMGGNDGSWERAVSYRTNNYQGEDIIADYSSSQADVSTAMAKAKSDIDGVVDHVNDPYESNFIIAHSMGGIVGRDLDRFYDQNSTLYSDPNRPYGGFVTFGSPHLGSKLADLNVNDQEKIEQFFEDACSSLGRGIAADIETDLGFFYNNVVSPLFSIDLGDIVEGAVCDQLSGLAIGHLESKFSTPIAEDIVPNSTLLQNVSNYPNIKNDAGVLDKGKHLAFYGIEDDNDDIFFRLAYSAVKDVNEYPLFGADEADQEALQLAQDVLDEYVSKANYWDRPYQDLKDNWWTRYCGIWYGMPICAWQAKEWRDEYKAGVNWFNRVNENWKTLIGARTLQSNQLVGCFCYKKSDPEPGPGGGVPVDYFEYEYEYVPIGTYNDCNEAEDELGYGWECSKHQKDVYVEIPSDGLVTSESAASMPNVGKQVKMPGSNHFQMRNDMELQDKLTKLFKGGHGQWFFLEKQ